MNAFGRPEISQREIACLKLFAVGLSDVQIGRHLGISTRTVRFHFDGIKKKLDAKRRAHALVRALQKGFIELNELSL